MWEILQTYSGAVVAIFTVVLVGVTVVYVLVTWKLLKQSKNALLAEITLRVMETWRKETKEMRAGEEEKVAVFAKAWMEGYRKTFMEIDKRLGMNLTELFKVCLSATYDEWERGEKKLLEEQKKRQRN